MSIELAEPQASTGAAGLEELVRRYGRLVRAAVERTGGRGLAGRGEDVEQRVYLALWQQLRREQTIAHPSSYLYKAAVRETIRLLREEASRPTLPLEADDGVMAESADRTAARDLEEALQHALAELQPERRRAVRAHLQGFTVEELMTMTGWPYHKARNLIARGVADLRAGLTKRGIDAGR